MKRIYVFIIPLLFLTGCTVNRYRNDFDFANRLAEGNLWKEAIYRYNRAISKGNNSAAVYNNLAIAYESCGEYEKAEQNYQLALKKDPGNTSIENNFEKLKKFLKKPDKDEKKNNRKKKRPEKKKRGADK